jgi:hypothetical protein
MTANEPLDPHDPHDPDEPRPIVLSQRDLLQPARSRWSGVVGVAAIMAAVAAAVVWSHDSANAARSATDVGATLAPVLLTETVSEPAVVEATIAAPVKQ